MTYDHTLRSNPRYLAAKATSQRSGAALEVEGSTSPEHSSWWLVVIGLIAVAVALWGLGL